MVGSITWPFKNISLYPSQSLIIYTPYNSLNIISQYTAFIYSSLQHLSVHNILSHCMAFIAPTSPASSLIAAASTVPKNLQHHLSSGTDHRIISHQAPLIAFISHRGPVDRIIFVAFIPQIVHCDISLSHSCSHSMSLSFSYTFQAHGNALPISCSSFLCAGG